MIYPMLAKPFNKSKITYPCFVQPKLNGVRAIYDHRYRRMQSRYGELWDPTTIPHVLSALTRLEITLDGEFYCHGMSLQQINSAIAVTRKSPSRLYDKIQYHVFDVVINKRQCDRVVILHNLKKIFEPFPQIQIVPTFEITNETEADYYYDLWRNKLNYEGMMYRRAGVTYGFKHECGNKENRWWHLIKRKATMDAEGVIVGYNQLHDQFGNPRDELGSFVVRMPNGATCNAGGGLKQFERVSFWNKRDELIGIRIRLEFEMYSDGGVPLKPIVDCVYEIH